MSTKLLNNNEKDGSTLYIHRDKSNHINRWVFVSIIVTLFTIFIFVAYKTHKNITGISVSKLVENQKEYHHKKIAVVGIVNSVEERKSLRGNIYYTTKLVDDKNHVNIFSFGRPTVREGQLVRVIGYYSVIKYVQPWSFENELDLTYGNIYDISNKDSSGLSVYLSGIVQRLKSNHKVVIPY